MLPKWHCHCCAGARPPVSHTDRPWLIVGDPFAYGDQALLSQPALLALFVACNTLVAFRKIQVPKIGISKLFSRQPSSHRAH